MLFKTCSRNIKTTRIKILILQLILLFIVFYLVYFIFIVNLEHKMVIFNNRDYLLMNEANMSLGANLVLKGKEEEVNTCLMKLKTFELDVAKFSTENMFSQHYFTFRKKIKDSKVYKLIQKMPKGAILHIHDMGIHNADYIMKLTYLHQDKLYVSMKNDQVRFKFSDSVPKTGDYKWELLSQVRNDKGEEQFNDLLRKHFTIAVQDEMPYKNPSEAWKNFLEYFDTVQSLLTFTPIWKKYIYDALKACVDQHILYIEIRTILPRLYELDGTEHNQMFTAKCYDSVIAGFVNEYPKFIGAKIIYSPVRLINPDELERNLLQAKAIQRQIPKTFAGFDLVGPEESGGGLEYFSPLLSRHKTLNYYLHAGETAFHGDLADENLADAICLGAKRLGHAYALTKHPLLRKQVIARDIGIEVNVISNVVLSLVKDVRNHPLSVLLAEGAPVVLSSDDPGVWEADLLAYDFYVAFVGIASRKADLRLIKTLALNSIKYSALEEDDKKRAYEVFEEQWKIFVNKFDCTNFCPVPEVTPEIAV